MRVIVPVPLVVSAVEAGHDAARLLDQASDHGLDMNETSQVR
jgi:hypothetical protein